ncbi:hypothetical protein, partial [Flavihumibacter solisilvae]
MKEFIKAFDLYVNTLFQEDNKEEIKRVIIQDIPSFVQQEMFEFYSLSNYSGVPIVFTGVAGESSNVKLFSVNTKDGILQKRNDSSIKKLIIISNIVLDRSSETAVTVINDFAKEKWKWINSSLGHFLLFSYFKFAGIEGKYEQDLVKKIIRLVGKEYPNGIDGQWYFLLRFFSSLENATPVKIDDLCFLLGLPKTGINRDISHSLSIFDKKVNFDKLEFANTIISSISNRSLNGFRDFVHSRIDEISEESSEYEMLS